MASRDTIIITIKTPLLLLQQRPRFQGARVCLRTSGNRTPKCKHGSEVPISPGLDPESGVRFYNSPWGAPMNRDPKGPSVLSPSTLTPNPVRPWHLTVQGCTAPGTPLYRGPEEDACRVSGARWARRGLGTGPRRAWERHPRRGGHWGKVPPARGPHTGRGTASPGGQRPRSAASRPARGRSYGPRHPHHHHHPPPPRTEEGSGSTAVGSILARGPLPTARLPAHSRAPRLTLSRVQVARGTQQQRGHRHQQRRSRRPPPSPGAHGCRSAGSRRIRARGAGPRGSCSEAAARAALGDARPSVPRRGPAGRSPSRKGPRNSPSRGAGPRPLQIRRRRGGGGPDPGPPRPGPRPAISRPGAPRCAPAARFSARSALGHDLRTLRQTDARTDRRADGRAGTWAGEWRAGGRAAGARAARPVNNAARQLGPVRVAGKGGADRDWEGTRRPGEAREGWREDREREAPPRPARQPPHPGPQSSRAPGAPGPRGRPDTPRLESQSLGAPQMPNPSRRIPSLTCLLFHCLGLGEVHLDFFLIFH